MALQDEINGLSARLDFVIATAASDATAAAAKLAELQAKLDAAGIADGTDLGAVQAQLNAQVAEVVDLQGQLATAKNDTATSVAQVEVLQAEIAAASAAVATLSAKLDAAVAPQTAPAAVEATPVPVDVVVEDPQPVV